MEIKTYTKKDIAKEFSRRSQNSTRASIKLTDHFFNILKDILIEDNLFTRIEIRNFGVFESKPTKAKPRARHPITNEESYVPAHKKSRYNPRKIIKNN